MPSVLLAFVKLIPDVRLRLTDQKSIEALNSSIQDISVKYSTKRELMAQLDEIRATLMSPVFIKRLEDF